MDIVRNNFMGLILTLMASTLQTQKYEMDKEISPCKLRLTSPISVEHLPLGMTINIFDFRIRTMDLQIRTMNNHG